MKIKELTKAEEQLMQILWVLGKGFVNDIIKELPEPKPAYNTVSTIVRILEKKGFVDHKVYGNTHEYFPLIAKEAYTESYFKTFLNDYFSNSFTSLLSFFSKNEKIDVKEMEDILKLLKKEIKTKKGE